MWDGGEASATRNTNWKLAQPEHSLFREDKGNLKFTIVMCYPDNHQRSYKPIMVTTLHSVTLSITDIDIFG